ncbi:hypothetical protein [Amycolatopsis sp. NPDC050768]|uniref:hypothetical protein n=1 Tax=Amycolatopsis sp. NPDC050768 TaxID=3154839 RepID=UPI0033D8A615
MARQGREQARVEAGGGADLCVEDGRVEMLGEPTGAEAEFDRPTRAGPPPVPCSTG